MKHCHECDAEVNEDAKFCSSCGSSAVEKGSEAKEQTGAALETHSQPQQQPAKKKEPGKFFKKPIVIALILLVIIGASTATAFLLKKSPKDVYLLAEYNGYNQTMTEFDERYGDFFEFQKLLLEKPSNSEVTVSGDFTIDFLEGIPDFDTFREMLNAASITATTVQNPETKEGHVALSLNLENEKVVDLEVYQLKEQLGFTVPFIEDKSFYLNNADYGKLMKMLDPYYNGPETLEYTDYDASSFLLTDDEKKHLTALFAKFVISELKDENFKIEKDVEYEHEGESMKLRAVTLTLSENEVKDLLKAFVDTVLADDEVHNMINKRNEIIMEAYEVGASEQLPSADELKEEMESELETLKEAVDALELPNGFTSTLMIDNKEQIIDRHMELALASDGKQGDVVITSKNVPYGENQEWKEWKLQLSPEDEPGELEIQYVNKIKNEKDTRTEDVTVAMVLDENGVKEDVTLTMLSTMNGENGIQREFDVKFNGDSFAYSAPQELKGEIKQESETNLKEGTHSGNYSVEVAVKDRYDDTRTVVVNLDTKTTLADEVELPSLDTDSENTYNVVELTQMDLYYLYEELGMNVYEVMEKYGINPEDTYYFY